MDSVCLTLALMPVGKASGIPVGAILKGTQCVFMCVQSAGVRVHAATCLL